MNATAAAAACACGIAHHSGKFVSYCDKADPRRKKEEERSRVTFFYSWGLDIMTNNNDNTAIVPLAGN